MSFLKRALKRSKIPVGHYTYRGTGDFAGMALQLRVELSGQGLLVINANTVLYLNETAAVHAYYFMQGLSVDEAVRRVKKIYRVKAEAARSEHEKLFLCRSTHTGVHDKGCYKGIAERKGLIIHASSTVPLLRLHMQVLL